MYDIRCCVMSVQSLINSVCGMVINCQIFSCAVVKNDLHFRRNSRISVNSNRIFLIKFLDPD